MIDPHIVALVMLGSHSKGELDSIEEFTQAHSFVQWVALVQPAFLESDEGSELISRRFYNYFAAPIDVYRLAVMLGGRSAEKEILGTVSSGADDDIHQATHLARAMVSRWGMSEDIGPVDLRESENHPFLGREIAQPRHYSEHSAEAVDDAVKKIILQAEEHALQTIRQHRHRLDKLIQLLEKRETLYKEQIVMCLGGAQNNKTGQAGNGKVPT